jgi:hypothetical protein
MLGLNTSIVLVYSRKPNLKVSSKFGMGLERRRWYRAGGDVEAVAWDRASADKPRHSGCHVRLQLGMQLPNYLYMIISTISMSMSR